MSKPPAKPGVLTYGMDDCSQKLQFLACGAVQGIDSLDYGGRMNFRYASVQFFLACWGFGVMNGHMNGRHTSDKGHLRGCCAVPDTDRSSGYQPDHAPAMGI